jgi:hypothetical protein
MSKTRNILSFDYAIKRQLRDKANYDIVSGFLSELFGHDVSITSIDESGITAIDGGREIQIDLQIEREFDIYERQLSEPGFTRLKDYQDCVQNGGLVGANHIRPSAFIKIQYLPHKTGKGCVYRKEVHFEGIHNKKDKFSLPIFPIQYLIFPNNFDGEVNDTLDEWMLYLSKDEVQATIKAKGLAKAKSILDYDKLSPEEQNEYDHALEAKRSLQSAFETVEYISFRKGEEMGAAKGRAEGAKANALETARTLKALGKLSTVEIAQATGLIVSEVEAL